ncbi:MAG: hypothetical protein ACM3S4_09775 [Burkholderiales bacterium]
MGKLRLTVWVMILVLLAACAPQGGKIENTPVYSSDNTVTEQSIETEPADSEPPNVSTDPMAPNLVSMVKPIDKNVPDITADSTEKANSNYTLYEDSENIYYLWKGNGLYTVSKSNGKATLISGDCECFTVHNEQLYFVENTDELKQYSTTISSIKPIVDIGKQTNSIACSGNRIYYTCTADIDSDEYSDILFTSDLNGNNRIKLYDDVDTFCLYNNRVFSVTMGELGYIQEYIPGDKGNRKELSSHVVYRNFDISFDRIICAEFRDDVFNCSNNLIYDVNTGQSKRLSIDDPEFAVTGQYIIYISEDETGEEIIIKAYDFLADKEYALLNISDFAGYYSIIIIHTTKDSTYLSMENYRDNSLKICKLIIENGQARLEHVASIVG